MCVTRATGSDIEQGEVVLSAGCVIGASEIGVLATVGVTKVTCHQLPIVGVMSSGNEVCSPITVCEGLKKCLGWSIFNNRL